eukprot:CCRYP_020692-RA/>CCRYP_020692-RA protein AED:0.08 eAED:0.08 QI:205/1/1/1/0/0/2/18/111
MNVDDKSSLLAAKLVFAEQNNIEPCTNELCGFSGCTCGKNCGCNIVPNDPLFYWRHVTRVNNSRVEKRRRKMSMPRGLCDIWLRKLALTLWDVIIECSVVFVCLLYFALFV